MKDKIEEKESVQQEQEYSYPDHKITIKAKSKEEADKKLAEELKKHKTL